MIGLISLQPRVREKPLGMDRQYTLCVLVPAQQYRGYVDGYRQPPRRHDYQRKHWQQPREQIYENVVSQYQMKMCYHNDYENDEQIQRFYWEQCYRKDNADATAYYYCEFVSFFSVSYFLQK